LNTVLYNLVQNQNGQMRLESENASQGLATPFPIVLMMNGAELAVARVKRTTQLVILVMAKENQVVE
jgi:hypothetical protein